MKNRFTVMMVVVATGVLSAFVLSGCGPGVRVLRSDAATDLDGGDWVVLPAQADDGARAHAVEEGLHESLTERWRSHRVVRSEQVERGFGVQVRLQRLVREPEEQPVALARVSFVDPSGTSIDEIETEVRGADDRDIGRALGERVERYVRDRHAYHH